MKSRNSALALLPLILFLAACGQSGPLYLPENHQEPPKQEASATPEETAEEQDQD